MGNGKVHTVGFRPLLTSAGYLDYNVEVFASNVHDSEGKKSKIRVLVDDRDPAAADRFIVDVRQKRLKPEGLKESDYEVGPAREVNDNHDYLRFTQALQLDQMSTFVSAATKMEHTQALQLDQMSTFVSAMRKVQSTQELQLDQMSNLVSETKLMRTELGVLPKNLAKELGALRKKGLF